MFSIFDGSRKRQMRFSVTNIVRGRLQWRVLILTLSSLALWVIPSVHSFVIPQCNCFTSAICPQHQRTQNRYAPRQMLPDVSSFISVVEVFDGSTIVDPVVVSDVFWTNLKGKLLAVVIGQALATLAFGLLSWFLSTQISQLGDFVTKTIFKGSPNESSPSRKFIKADEIRPPPDFGKLLICLVIDILGSSSGLVPFLGELTDIIYAPIAATVLRNLYGSNILFGLEFAEEILPFTDILPLATICWVVDTFLPESDIAKLLKLGFYNPRRLAENAIDVNAEVSRSTKTTRDNADR